MRFAQKFTRRTSTNKIAPRDGSPPLRKIELSLTNEARDDMWRAVGEVVKKDDYSREELENAMLGALPDPIVDELVRFRDEKKTSDVYAIHNLIEVPKSKVPRSGDRKHYSEFAENHSFSHVAQRVLSKQMKLHWDDKRNYTLARRFREKYIEGWVLHKHGFIDMLGIITTDGAKTGFTDMAAMLEEAKDSASYKDIPINADIDQKEPIKFGDYAAVYPDWRYVRELAVVAADADDRKKLSELTRKHSQQVKGGKGTLIVWANDGNLYHQALYSRDHFKKYGLARLAHGHGFER